MDTRSTDGYCSDGKCCEIGQLYGLKTEILNRIVFEVLDQTSDTIFDNVMEIIRDPIRSMIFYQARNQVWDSVEGQLL